MRKRLVSGSVITFALFASAVGIFSLAAVTSTPVEAKRCGPCPLYCIGVICDDGREYCNSCLAACAGAGHCTPNGGGL